jgi:NADH-quinone oxidoreductase subunit M
MTDFPILTFIVFTPAVGALLTLLVPKSRPELLRIIGFVTMITTAAFSGWLVYAFKIQQSESLRGSFQFVEDHAWYRELGVRYIMGVDGISIFMIALTALLFPIGLLASANVTHRLRSYVAAMLLLEAGILGVFVSLDLILFFVFWEVMLVPMYFIIVGWGYDRRIYAGVKFFLYTMAGSALMLVGILTLAFLHQRGAGGSLTFDLRILQEWGGLAPTTARWLFLAFFISFAIKVPLFPFHTWLPDAHVEAPTAGSVILAGVLLKMGTYGFLRFSLTLFPQASVDFAPLLLVLATIGILYGAIVATVQKDMKKLIAYSSVAHLGFVVLGTFALTTQGIQGGLFTMISHGLTTGALFLIVGMMYERRHTRAIADYGGVWKIAPKLGGAMLIAAFASAGLPGMSGFIGEFLALLGAFLSHRPYAIISAVGVILAALYLLWMFQRVFTGEPTGDNLTMKDLNAREILTLVPLLGLSVFLGVYPKPVLDRLEPSVKALIVHVEQHSDWCESDHKDAAGTCEPGDRFTSEASGTGGEGG